MGPGGERGGGGFGRSTMQAEISRAAQGGPGGASRGGAGKRRTTLPRVGPSSRSHSGAEIRKFKQLTPPKRTSDPLGRCDFIFCVDAQRELTTGSKLKRSS